MRKKKNIILFIVLVLIIIVGIFAFIFIKNKNTDAEIWVNLTDLTYNGGRDVKKYSQGEFDTFINDYSNDKLPSVYVTEFLFDGVFMYKPYDLDDFIDNGNDYGVDALEITVVNVNTSGDVTFSGSIKGGMVAVNTNELDNDINIILNNVNIDTDSKKVPAIYVFNKDITYNKHKVTIKTLDGTKNYIEGGKLKKVSLIGSDNLSNYANNYSGDRSEAYQSYTNYYGVYSENDINNILFAKVQADREDLLDGDPYYYYKASGAISSDIDLYFEGSGYLEITSKNKEGVESKGNLSFIGGVGDYVINSEDDCLNTTTDSSEVSGAHNTMVIDVNSLTAMVYEDADEGDAIDSNGTLTINGGSIIAIAHPGQDAGLDSSDGTYINGGTIIATGDMYDEISNASNQRFIGLSFSEGLSENTLITLLDENDMVIFSYLTDRNYTNLIYSSPKLVEGKYYLYKGGDGLFPDSTSRFFDKVSSYIKGVQLGYSSAGMQGGPNGLPMNDMPNQESHMGNMMDDNRFFERYSTVPQIFNNEANSLNKEFAISQIQNLFSGIGECQD